MEYIKQETLKLLIYFLYGNTEIELAKIVNQYSDLFAFISETELENSFYFKINKNQINKYPELFDFKKTFETDTVGNIYQKVKNRKNDKKITFSDITNDYSDNLNFLPVCIFYNINTHPKGKIKLQDYLNKYMESFKNNTLDSQQNYYDFIKCFVRSIKIFDSYYNKFHKKFRFSGYKELDSIAVDIESELRIYEIILYFQNNKYITIETCNFIKLNAKDVISLNLTFNKSPVEIFNIEKEQIKLKNKKLMELKLKFDFEKGIITYEDKIYNFNKWDNQGIVLETIFNHEYGVNVDVEEIRNALDRAKIKEKKRTIKDAVYAINKKAEQYLNIKLLLIWQRSTVKINDIFDI